MNTEEKIKRIDKFLCGFQETIAKIKLYVEESDRFLTNKIGTIENNIAENTKDLDIEEMINQINLYYEYELNDYLGIFPDIKNKSLAIMAYSFLETNMRNLSYLLKDIEGLSTKPENYKTDGIIKYSLYFSNDLKINYKDYKLIWRDIDKFRLIRNTIVHNQSDLESNDRIRYKKELSDYINTQIGIEFIDNRFIGLLNTDYIIYVLDLQNDLLQTICNTYKTNIERQ